MQTISLDGRWEFSQQGKNQWLPAAVPGCIHTDLLKNGSIPDPFFRDSENQIQWITDKSWTYRRSFRISRSLLAHDRVLLRCEGLDTLALIRLNGRKIASTDNMYRTWTFAIRDHLVPGRNTVEVTFASVARYHREGQQVRIRKEPCNFGWDWNITAVTCGIWRSIGIVAFSNARIDDVHITQQHHRNGSVSVSASVRAGRCAPGRLMAAVAVTRNGSTVAAGNLHLPRNRATAVLKIKNPRLWWPNGMGDQPLYTVSVILRTAAGTVLDTWSRRIGLRTVGLDQSPDRWGTAFRFKVNGVPFFAKGANWVPADTFASRITGGHYGRLIREAVFANMNMLRVWGGGIYEPDLFYDLCDEHGICVWQDFHFSCAAYPADDPDFMENVRHESADTIRRLRHHACLALWCGNNELELLGRDRRMGHSMYNRLFNRLLPDQVKKFDPATCYLPSSPHAPGQPRVPQAMDRGDTHLWQVWFSETTPITWYEGVHTRFCSEFGLQSLPDPRTVRTFTRPQDRSFESPVMLVHQKAFIGNTKIMRHILNWFRYPKDLDATIILSQIIHGLCMKFAVEHWRRTMPRCMGALYWQYNDSWPVVSGSGMDYYGRRKALHYMARRFFAPVLVSADHDPDSGKASLYVCNDTREPVSGVLHWHIGRINGTPVAHGSRPVTIRPGNSKKAGVLGLRKHLKPPLEHQTLLWLEFKSRGRLLSENTYYYTTPAMFRLPDPEIRTTINKTGVRTFEIRLHSTAPALWVVPELRGHDSRFSDSYFHLRPGMVRTISLETARTMSVAAVRKKLVLMDLTSTYTPSDAPGF